MKQLLISFLFLSTASFRTVVQTQAHNRFGAVQWKYRTGGKIFSSPLVYRNLVLIGSEDKALYAVNALTGDVAWKFTTNGPVHGSPVAIGERVFFLSYDGHLYALDGKTGKLLWAFRTRGEKRVGAKSLWTMKPVNEYMDDPFDFFLSSPAADSGTGLLYFGSSDGNLYALRITDGALQWRFQTGGIIHTSPVLSGNTVYFGSWDRFLYALDSRTGKEKWKFRTGADTAYHLLEGIQSSPLVYAHHLYFGARDGYFYSLDAETGRQIWKYSANNSWILTTAAAGGKVIYTGTSDTYLLLALDTTTGKEIFRAAANGYVYSSPVIDGNSVYFGDFSGQLLAVNRLSGEVIDRWETPGRQKNGQMLLKNNKVDFAYVTKGMDLAYYATTVDGMNKLYTLGPILSTPAIGHGMIYFGSADGCLYAIRLNPSGI